jgi:hypothetical protein
MAGKQDKKPKQQNAPSRGRPSKFKPEYCDLLIEHMKKGFGINTFGPVVDVNRDTVYEWVNVHQDFSDAYKKGMDHYEGFWERLGMAGAMGKVPGFNAAAWIFNVKNRFKWTDRQETTHEVGESIKVILEDYSKDE